MASLGKLNHMRKFYKAVNVVPYPEMQNHYLITLDDKKPKSPDGYILTTRSLDVAHIVQNEFRAQKDYIIPTTMPMVC